jgi:hypothetical protein
MGLEHAQAVGDRLERLGVADRARDSDPPTVETVERPAQP